MPNGPDDEGKWGGPTPTQDYGGVLDEAAFSRRDGEVRVQRPRRAAPADAVRPTRADINLGALRNNLRVVRRVVQSASPARPSPEVSAEAPKMPSGPPLPAPQVWGVLKADAYGHGAPALARTLERAGVDALCVALLEEGIELRSAGIRVPILVMGGYYGLLHRGLEDALEHELTPVLYEASQLERFAIIARDRLGDKRAAFHLKVDTNMARLGTPPAELDAILDLAASLPNLQMSGLMSHLACSDAADLEPTRDQVRRFEDVRRRARQRGLVPDVCHVANSAGAFAFPASRYEAIRPGIALFGISPFYGRTDLDETLSAAMADLKPAMRVRTEIVALRTLQAGDRVGYGHTWVANGERRIATIPMGYADGLSRALSNRGSVLVRGKRAPIAGIVSMDLTTIDVTDIPLVQLRDEVVILGSASDSSSPRSAREPERQAAEITAGELAELTGTIPWEVITSISRRVPRFYREP